MVSLQGSHSDDPIVIDDEEHSPDQTCTINSSEGTSRPLHNPACKRSLDLPPRQPHPRVRMYQLEKDQSDNPTARFGDCTDAIRQSVLGLNYAASGLGSSGRHEHHQIQIQIPEQALIRGSSSTFALTDRPLWNSTEHSRITVDTGRHPHSAVAPTHRDMVSTVSITPSGGKTPLRQEAPSTQAEDVLLGSLSAMNYRVEKEKDSVSEVIETDKSPSQPERRSSRSSDATINLGLLNETQAAPIHRGSGGLAASGKEKCSKRVEVDMDALKAHDKEMAMNPRKRCSCTRCVHTGTCFRIILRHQQLCRPCIYGCYQGEADMDADSVQR
jgi:hypothetical protein